MQRDARGFVRLAALGAVAMLVLFIVAGWLRRLRAALQTSIPMLGLETAHRMLVSEVPKESYEIKRALLWCIRNLAEDQTLSIYDSGTRGLGFGPVGPRPYDTRETPSALERRLNDPLVRLVLASPQADDPTHGANDWFQPGEQDQFVAAHVPGYTRSAAQVIAQELADGAQDLGTVGTGNGRVQLFRKPLHGAAA